MSTDHPPSPKERNKRDSEPSNRVIGIIRAESHGTISPSNRLRLCPNPIGCVCIEPQPPVSNNLKVSGESAKRAHLDTAPIVCGAKPGSTNSQREAKDEPESGAPAVPAGDRTGSGGRRARVDPSTTAAAPAGKPRPGGRGFPTRNGRKLSVLMLDGWQVRQRGLRLGAGEIAGTPCGMARMEDRGGPPARASRRHRQRPRRAGGEGCGRLAGDPVDFGRRLH